MSKTCYAISVGSFLAAALTIFFIVQLLASEGVPKEASEVSRVAPPFPVYPRPPSKSALAAGIDVYSLDDSFVDTRPFGVGSFGGVIPTAGHANRYPADSVVMASDEPVSAYHAELKGTSQ